MRLKSPGNAHTDQVKSEIRKILAEFPGYSFSMNSFLAERIEETLSGEQADLSRSPVFSPASRARLTCECSPLVEAPKWSWYSFHHACSNSAFAQSMSSMASRLPTRAR